MEVVAKIGNMGTIGVSRMNLNHLASLLRNKQDQLRKLKVIPITNGIGLEACSKLRL